MVGAAVTARERALIERAAQHCGLSISAFVRTAALGEIKLMLHARRDPTKAAVRFAEEHDVDLTLIRGSGVDGQVVKADVRGWLGKRSDEEEE